MGQSRGPPTAAVALDTGSRRLRLFKAARWTDSPLPQNPKRCTLPIAGRLFVGQDFLESVPAELILPAGSAPSQLAGQHLPANVSPELRVGSRSGAFLSGGSIGG
jgi:hypothetical protein